ncbi:MAG TPA: ABC transporter substrate-binding protein [Acidimicrobiales bacterium]|nr:ABC transporter substrate-binding protein [Acidimicrobiales bacterium]
MQGSTRVRAALAVAGIASLVLASSLTAGAATTKVNAAAAKLVPAAYKHITLQVATDATYPPDEFMQGTKMVGFDIDLMNALAATLGIKIKENSVTFDNILAGIKSGRYQIGNSSFTDNKAREKTNNFVDYFQAGEGVYASSKSKVTFKGLKSFCGLTVAVETGTSEQSDAQATAKTCPANKKVTVRTFATQTAANLAVSSGQAAVGFVDSQVAGYIVSQSHGKFKLVGNAVNVAPYGIATAKSPSGHGLAIALRAALKVLEANGTYKSILTHWGVQAGAIPASRMILNGATS